MLQNAGQEQCFSVLDCYKFNLKVQSLASSLVLQLIRRPMWSKEESGVRFFILQTSSTLWFREGYDLQWTLKIGPQPNSGMVGVEECSIIG